MDDKDIIVAVPVRKRGAYVHKTSRITKKQRDRRARKMRDALPLVGGLLPYPIPYLWRSDDEEPVQETLCERYTECLHVSAFADWERFTCRKCPVWKEKFR